MKRTIDIEQEYYCKGCDHFIPDIVKMYTDGGKVMFEYLVCTHADECHRLHEHIQHRMNFELDKTKKRIAELEDELDKYDVVMGRCPVLDQITEDNKKWRCAGCRYEFMRSEEVCGCVPRERGDN